MCVSEHITLSYGVSMKKSLFGSYNMFDFSNQVISIVQDDSSVTIEKDLIGSNKTETPH